MFARLVRDADTERREEVHRELMAPLDPWEQAEVVFGELQQQR